MESMQLEKYASGSRNMYWETPADIHLAEQLCFLVADMTFVLPVIYSVVLYVKSTYWVLLHLDAYMQNILQGKFSFSGVLLALW